MRSRLELETLPACGTPDEQNGRSQREAIDDRDFGLYNTELECDREPGRAQISVAIAKSAVGLFIYGHLTLDVN